jgi:pimeloyl-ACP methyl ester carboxylesterase
MLLHTAIEGHGPRVALLHPVGLHGGFLAPLARRLARHYQVMRIDLRGHGESPLQPLGHSMADFADDVHETLRAHGFAPCALGGFSFGSMTAQELAIRHPSDVCALLALAGPCTYDAPRRAAIAARGTDSLAQGMAAVIDATMERWFTPAFRQSAEALAAREYLLARDPRGWAQGWKAISGLDTEPRLHQLRIPALCVAGECDVSSTPTAVRRIADAIPGACYVELPGAPHMLFIEQLDATAAVMMRFLGSLPSHRTA